MLGLIFAIILFNSLAFITNKNLTKNQIVHLWLFTALFQIIVDLFLGEKFKAYWYFTKGIEFDDLPILLLVIPSVNMMFLNWYPFQASLLKRFIYIVCWSILVTIYEAITLLPEPWGYFNYGWWNLGFSAICYPILLLSLLLFYKWICKLEKIN